MDLCEKCLNIDLKPLTPFVPYVRTTIAGNSVIPTEGDLFHIHSHTFRDLEQSAFVGCRFCRILEYNLKHWISPWIREYDAEGSWRPKDEDDVGVLLRLSPDRRTLRVLCERHIVFDRVSIPSAFVPFTDKASLDELDTTTGSSKCLTLLKSWLYDCMLEHDGCLDYAHSGEQTLPTRVIDVGPPGNDQDHVLLVASNGRSAPYVALSHCWGKSNIVTTTTSNLGRHQQQGIPVQSLPRNFQDAVAVTRALACRYLWIDSLCIVQDSREDWEVESGRMHLVYRKASLTISVARSSNPHTGCFINRDASLLRPISLPIPIPEPESTVRYNADADSDEENKEDDDDESNNSDDENGHDNFENDSYSFWQLLREPPPDGPLHHRAWVLQEQAFSGRVVSFSDEGIFWSCASAEQSECTPHRRRKRRLITNRAMYHRFQEQVVESEDQPVSSRLRGSNRRRRQLYNAWYDIVSEYSKRDLTFETDRLQAIASLARETSRILDDTYFAGLWRRDLARGLLWSALPSSRYAHLYRRMHPPMLYVAPSWSWASVLGDTVHFEAWSLNHGIITETTEIHVPGLGNVPEERWEQLPEPGDDEVEVLDITCSPAGRNEFGQLRNGILQLEGPVKRMILRMPNDLYDPMTRKRLGHLVWDEAHPPASLEGRVLRCLFMARNRYRLSGDEETPLSETAMVMSEIVTQTLCLALIPTGLGRPNECCRLGLARLDNDGDWSGVDREEVEIV